MAKIINPSRRDIDLPTGHVVPARAFLETSNAMILVGDNAATLNALRLSGAITIELDPELDDSPALEPTPEPQLAPPVDDATAAAPDDSALPVKAKR